MVVYFGMKGESANYSTKHCENASGLPRIVLVSVFKVVLTLEEMQSRFMRFMWPYGFPLSALVSFFIPKTFGMANWSQCECVWWECQ